MKNVIVPAPLIARNQSALRPRRGHLAVLSLLAGLLTTACQSPHVDTATSANGARVDADARPTNVLYLSNNNPDSNQEIMAFRRNTDGTVTPLPLANNPFSRFTTNGLGIPNPDELLGPEDLDYALASTEDKKFMFAVNGGSNTVAVFQVLSDGSLAQIPGSPFASGGIDPAALYVAGNKLYVVNKNDNANYPNEENPNYRTFTIGSDGSLSAIPDAVIQAVPHTSPSNIILSPNRKIAFGTDFLPVFRKTAQTGSLRSFTVGSDGKLMSVPGSPIAVEGGGALGLWAHPTQNVLYVGLPLAGKVGVYTYDAAGKLTLSTSLAAGAAACWLRLNRAGTRLYSLNSAESTISVYDTGGNPASPSTVEKYVLKNPGPIFYNAGGPNTSSEPFAEEFSPDEKYLYVICQHVNPDHTLNYNYLHTLVISPEGKLSEPTAPYQIPAGGHFRPQGLVIY